jgi:purine-binding chemotaxis protein CheW
MSDFAQKNSADFDSVQLNTSFFYGNQSEQTKGEKYVVFCLGTKFFGVSSGNVSEVAQRLSVTPLPNVPEWLLGIADLRGEIISIIGLKKFLGTFDTILSPQTKFIILQSPDFSSSVAVAVDKLCEIIVLSNEEIQSVEDEKTPFLSGKTEYKLNPLNLLNVENLFSSLTI